MPMPETEASYRGVVSEAVLSEKNGRPQLVLTLQCEGMFARESEDSQEEKWCDLPDSFGWTATAYLFPMTKTGELNEVCINQLKEAFDWKGQTSLGDLPDFVMGRPVQFDLREETYNGKTSLKVAWIRAYDANPNRKAEAAGEDKVKEWDALLGNAFAALGGDDKPDPGVEV